MEAQHLPGEGAARTLDPRTRTVLSWCVHFYTGLGLVTGLMALRAGVEGRHQEAFFWLFAALFIDSTDGTMARAVDVTRWAPQFDGRKLDDITDYLNYVFIPVYFAYLFGLVDGNWLPVLFLPLLASGYGFCHEGAKTADNFFTGFPSYWNIVVLYAYLLKLPGWVNALAIALLALLVFVPVKYIYPSKTKAYQGPTLVLTCLWFLAIFILLFDVKNPNATLVWVSLLYVVYYFGLSIWLQFGGPSAVET